jgi:hypothetical protein
MKAIARQANYFNSLLNNSLWKDDLSIEPLNTAKRSNSPGHFKDSMSISVMHRELTVGELLDGESPIHSIANQ